MSDEIRIYSEDVLREDTEPIENITDEVIEIAERMKQIMIDANGIGLAGPQIGETRKIICVRELVSDDRDEDKFHILLNPELRQVDGEQEGLEGCLSLPTLYGTVLRDDRVLAEGTNPEGETIQIEAEGLLARALQHEINHLSGVLFTDLIEDDSLVWRVPDEDAEDGFRFEATDFDEIAERFERLRKARRKKR